MVDEDEKKKNGTLGMSLTDMYLDRKSVIITLYTQRKYKYIRMSKCVVRTS